MASIDTILQLTVLVAGFAYIGINLSTHNKLKIMKLRMDQIRFINDPEVDRALTEILWVWEWSDFDDYWKKYSPRANP